MKGAKIRSEKLIFQEEPSDADIVTETHTIINSGPFAHKGPRIAGNTMYSLYQTGRSPFKFGHTNTESNRQRPKVVAVDRCRVYEAGSAYRIQPHSRSNARAVARSLALKILYSDSDGPRGHCTRTCVLRVGHFHRKSSKSSKHATDGRSP